MLLSSHLYTSVREEISIILHSTNLTRKVCTVLIGKTLYWQTIILFEKYDGME